MDATGHAMRALGATIPASSTCSHISSEFSACQVQSMCSLCITTGSCQFNMVNLSCENKSTDTNGTATTYCSSNDTVCSLCTVTATHPICRGEDGSCICLSLCSVIQPTDSSDCSSTAQSISAYVGVAVGMICVAFFAFLMLRCRRRYLAISRQRVIGSHRRHQSELLRMRQPQLALNLMGWRDTVELNKPEMHKLGACSYAINQEERNGNAEATFPMGAIAAFEVEQGDPSTSMETTSTFSELQSPLSSGGATPPASSPMVNAKCDDSEHESGGERVHNILSDDAAANGDCSPATSGPGQDKST